MGNKLLDIGTWRTSGVGPFGQPGGSGTLFNGIEQGDGGGFIRCTRSTVFGGTNLPNLGSRKLKFATGAE
jgi:hypothetical protein